VSVVVVVNMVTRVRVRLCGFNEPLSSREGTIGRFCSLYG